MTYYNMSAFFAANDYYEMTKAADDLTGNILVPGLLLIGGLIIFMGLLTRYEPLDSLVAASFVTTILSISLATIDLIQPTFLYYIVPTSSVLIVYYVVRSRYG